MTNLSIYDPFGTRLNRFINNFVLNHSNFLDEPEALNGPTLKMDLSEDDKNYYVHADLPGVKKEDIRISVDSNQVSISADIKSHKEEKKGKSIIHSERYEGKTYRSFTLGCGIDDSNSSAKFTDGVLELTLPKKAEGNSIKQIKVQ